jgi:hypothetical protein
MTEMTLVALLTGVIIGLFAGLLLSYVVYVHVPTKFIIATVSAMIVVFVVLLFVILRVW